MSHIIKSISQLQTAMDKYAAYITDKIADKVKSTIEEFIRLYYHEYSPELYLRTYEFLNSVVKTKTVKTGDTWCSNVYIDTSIIYSNGWTMEGTAEQANKGCHGWNNSIKVSDMKFWDDAMVEIHSHEFINCFAGFLRSKGLNVTIK